MVENTVSSKPIKKNAFLLWIIIPLILLYAGFTLGALFGGVGPTMLARLIFCATGLALFFLLHQYSKFPLRVAFATLPFVTLAYHLIFISLFGRGYSSSFNIPTRVYVYAPFVLPLLGFFLLKPRRLTLKFRGLALLVAAALITLLVPLRLLMNGGYLALGPLSFGASPLYDISFFVLPAALLFFGRTPAAQELLLKSKSGERGLIWKNLVTIRRNKHQEIPELRNPLIVATNISRQDRLQARDVILFLLFAIFFTIGLDILYLLGSLIVGMDPYSMLAIFIPICGGYLFVWGQWFNDMAPVVIKTTEYIPQMEDSPEIRQVFIPGQGFVTKVHGNINALPKPEPIKPTGLHGTAGNAPSAIDLMKD